MPLNVCISGVKRLFSGLNRLQPPFEFGNSGLGYYDFFRRIDGHVDGQPAAEPYRNILDGAAGYYELPVGAVEVVFGQLGLQCFERLVDRVCVPVIGICRNPFVAGIEKDNIKTFEKMWTAQGIAWFCEIADTTYIGDTEFKIINAYYGSSSYNSKQMARLIDGVVQDCKVYEIETKPQAEIDSLLRSWDNG